MLGNQNFSADKLLIVIRKKRQQKFVLVLLLLIFGFVLIFFGVNLNKSDLLTYIRILLSLGGILLIPYLLVVLIIRRTNASLEHLELDDYMIEAMNQNSFKDTMAYGNHRLLILKMKAFLMDCKDIHTLKYTIKKWGIYDYYEMVIYYNDKKIKLSFSTREITFFDVHVFESIITKIVSENSNIRYERIDKRT